MGIRMDRRRLAWAGAALAVLLLSQWAPSVSFAQDLQPINEVSEYIQGFLTGRLATSLAIIAVAVVGYLFWAGQVAARSALSVVVGIAIVFGSAQIVAVLEGVAR
jgi:type IV secretion system protein VirB2